MYVIVMGRPDVRPGTWYSCSLVLVFFFQKKITKFTVPNKII